MILELRSLDDPIGPRTLVMGIGSGGIAAVSPIDKPEYPCATWAAISSEEKEVNEYTTAYRLLIESDNADPSYYEEIANEHVEELKELISKYKLVVLVAGLGGRVGTGVTPVVAEICKELGILTVIVVSMPYVEADELKTAIAKAGLLRLKPYADAIFVVDRSDEILIHNREHELELINMLVRYATEGALDASKYDEYEVLDSDESRQELIHHINTKFKRMKEW